jgi:hypothetical protein
MVNFYFKKAHLIQNGDGSSIETVQKPEPTEMPEVIQPKESNQKSESPDLQPQNGDEEENNSNDDGKHSVCIGTRTKCRF